MQTPNYDDGLEGLQGLQDLMSSLGKDKPEDKYSDKGIVGQLMEMFMKVAFTIGIKTLIGIILIFNVVINFTFLIIYGLFSIHWIVGIVVMAGILGGIGFSMLKFKPRRW